MLYQYDKLPKAKVKKNEIKVDWELFTKILKYRSISMSKSQDLLAKFLTDWVYENIKNVLVEEDQYGNLYITKGTSDLYPCLVAHLDISQEECANFEVVHTKDLIIGIDTDYGNQIGLGFDDKAGVMVALTLLKELDNVKVFFSKDEEVGCRGTSACVLDFFEDCSFIAQGDRRSSTNDISSYTNGVEVNSKEFQKALAKINSTYSYKFAKCVYTDVGELVEMGVGICAFNYSVGYFNEHNDDEILSKNHFINALHYVHDIVKEISYKRWEFIPEVKEPKWNWDDEDDIADIDFDNSWHYCPTWNFTKEDEAYVKDCIDIGQCAICQGSLKTALEGESICDNCGSVYNIPANKSIAEVWEELDFLEINKMHV